MIECPFSNVEASSEECSTVSDGGPLIPTPTGTTSTTIQQADPGSLPVTGAETATLVVLAVALIVAGLSTLRWKRSKADDAQYVDSLFDKEIS